MEESPFGPPKADLLNGQAATETSLVSWRSSFGAILVGGVLAGGILEIVALLAVGFAAFSFASSRGVSLDRLEPFFNGQTVPGELFLSGWGLAFSVLGGAVTARLANARHAVHAGAAGLVWALVLFSLDAAAGFPRALRPLAPLTYAAIALRVPASAVGGVCARRIAA